MMIGSADHQSFVGGTGRAPCLAFSACHATSLQPGLIHEEFNLKQLSPRSYSDPPFSLPLFVLIIQLLIFY